MRKGSSPRSSGNLSFTDALYACRHLAALWSQRKETAMLCNGYDKILELSHGDLAELSDARGTTVRVTKGTIWMTQEQDTQDIVLRAGDVWTVERQGLTLLE